MLMRGAGIDHALRLTRPARGQAIALYNRYRAAGLCKFPRDMRSREPGADNQAVFR